MSLGQSFRLAIKSIMSSKVRSLLTMLGIIIGVGAVILIVGLGNGMEMYMRESFESMGTNLLTLNITGRGSTRAIDEDDMYLFVAENSEYFDGLSPTVSVSASIKIGSDEMESTSTMGVSEEYGEMKDYTMESGRYIQYADVLNRTKVAVIGNYIDDTFFFGDSLGETIKINGDLYTVVGVVEETADSSEGSTDDFVHVTYTNGMNIANLGTLSTYTLSMINEEESDMAIAILENELFEVFQDDSVYRITSAAEMLDTMTGMIDVLITILAAIAAISLIVGGIGIMNIMLISVSERTREIGIRKSLGAKPRNILTQFVIEAATTSAMGGVIGILTGYGLAAVGTQVVVSMLETDITIAPTADSVLLSFGVSVAIGILFGYLPARKAAKLNPIDALRRD